jgi:hypothetical protein
MCSLDQNESLRIDSPCLHRNMDAEDKITEVEAGKLDGSYGRP